MYGMTMCAQKRISVTPNIVINSPAPYKLSTAASLPQTMQNSSPKARSVQPFLLTVFKQQSHATLPPQARVLHHFSPRHHHHRQIRNSNLLKLRIPISRHRRPKLLPASILLGKDTVKDFEFIWVRKHKRHKKERS